MKFFIILISAVFAIQVAFAGSKSGDSGGGGAPEANVNAGSKETSKQNNTGQGLAMVMGAGLTAAGVYQIYKQNYVMGALLIGMGVLSFMQSKEHGDVAEMADETGLESESGGEAPTAGVPELGGNKKMENLATDSFNGNINKINAAGLNGIKANLKDGSVSIDGKTYPASTFSSPASMQAAGFSQKDIAAAMDAAGKAEKQVAEKMKLGAMTATNGFDSGGSGSGAAVAAAEEPAAAAAAGAANLDLMGRDPASMAGMTKDFNGEPIGVSSDSIFLMMNRRYILKDKQNSFINENDLLLQK